MKPLPAVILAAGKGQRLGDLTDTTPKPMVEVAGCKIIDNLIDQLIKFGTDRIVVVTGYLHDTLAAHLQKYATRTEIIIIENIDYATTNNIYSLWLAREYLTNGFFLFEADVFLEEEITRQLLLSKEENIILVGKFTELMNGTVVSLSADLSITGMYLKRHQTSDFKFTDKYKTINFYRIGQDFAQNYFVQELNNHIERGDLNSYYELIIQEALKRNFQFRGLAANNLKWWEIDTPEDLKYCEGLFNKV